MNYTATGQAYIDWYIVAGTIGSFLDRLYKNPQQQPTAQEHPETVSVSLDHPCCVSQLLISSGRVVYPVAETRPVERDTCGQGLDWFISHDLRHTDNHRRLHCSNRGRESSHHRAPHVVRYALCPYPRLCRSDPSRVRRATLRDPRPGSPVFEPVYGFHWSFDTDSLRSRALRCHTAPLWQWQGPHAPS